MALCDAFQVLSFEELPGITRTLDVGQLLVAGRASNPPGDRTATLGPACSAAEEARLRSNLAARRADILVCVFPLALCRAAAHESKEVHASLTLVLCTAPRQCTPPCTETQSIGSSGEDRQGR